MPPSGNLAVRLVPLNIEAAHSVGGSCEPGTTKDHIPLARNQYINNSPGIFLVFARVQIQARHVFARTEPIPQAFGKIFLKYLPKRFSCVRTSANTGPACIRAENQFSKIFPACIGFLPGGNVGKDGSQRSPRKCLCVLPMHTHNRTSWIILASLARSDLYFNQPLAANAYRKLHSSFARESTAWEFPWSFAFCCASSPGLLGAETDPCIFVVFLPFLEKEEGQKDRF